MSNVNFLTLQKKENNFFGKVYANEEMHIYFVAGGKLYLIDEKNEKDCTVIYVYNLKKDLFDIDAQNDGDIKKALKYQVEYFVCDSFMTIPK